MSTFAVRVKPRTDSLWLDGQLESQFVLSSRHRVLFFRWPAYLHRLSFRCWVYFDRCCSNIQLAWLSLSLGRRRETIGSNRIQQAWLLPNRKSREGRNNKRSRQGVVMTSSAARRERRCILLEMRRAFAVFVRVIRAIPILLSLESHNRGKSAFDVTTFCECPSSGFEIARRRVQSGFTLIELMVTIAILAIVLTIATPSFTNIILSNRIDSIAHELHDGLQLARSEAIMRKGAVRVCRSNADNDDCAAGSDWTAGWLILSQDDEVMKVWQEVQGTVVTGPSDAVVFYGSGMANAEEEFSVTAPGCSNNQKRTITLRRVGSSILNRGHCDD